MTQLSEEDASIVIDWIQALEERVNVYEVLAKLAGNGYTEKEIDRGLKALGKIAGRDCGLT